MTEAPKGTKQLVMGGVLVGLSLLTVLLSRMLGFELDPFYGAIGILGAGFFLVGAVRTRSGDKRHAARLSADSAAKRHAGS